jgi:DNA-binding NarL/FixJ family response regulator
LKRNQVKLVSLEHNFNEEKGTTLPDPHNETKETELKAILSFISEYGLTKCEKRIWSYLRVGYMPKEIAVETGMSYGNIREQVRTTRNKMIPKVKEILCR